ncbi:hypothetical protein VTN31DRAFT_4091 [Thermomyces dupontii]|uniref:uncharacterized protein n=1 Tax=Talaromyces thermophilus TaxID=28565 RepID=UPI0037425B05
MPINASFFSEESFLKYCTEDPRGLYAALAGELTGIRENVEQTQRILGALAEQYQALKEEYQAVKVEYPVLKQEYCGLKEGYQHLKEEYEGLRDEYQILKDEFPHLREALQAKDEAIAGLVNERDHYKQALAEEVILRRRTTMRSAPLPDPPILTDGVDPPFELWQARIKGKLRFNADYYPTAWHRVEYVLTRLGGEAARHTMRRARDGAPDPYEDEEDIFGHLREIFPMRGF